MSRLLTVRVATATPLLPTTRKSDRLPALTEEGRKQAFDAAMGDKGTPMSL
ncbi:MAG: hypothetical protein M3O33_21470 [Cyanobacteriota bacterium]|nr:hypothetical protein [Cyanobacteriota bacterium]